ncbi:gamma carbonic anhydrase family protein [Natrononativus amylolyticus]|uniref:gamma carbonic anhydrase family protein n=1 Tax=Natrononativus amylolyticus TaxID=2963434 RepID=UPI0020CDD243|nr:gamma carbonic anhydrase family protein [Natrononativus amylolyticus]
MIRSFDGHVPEIADSAYVDERAVVIGEVTLETEASVWPGAVLRGDHGEIVLREGANVQDNATLHEGCEIGPYATVGHNAIVHAATVGERSMIGMGAIVLDRAEIGAESLIGANSVVTEDTAIPDSALAVGAPAEVVREVENSAWTAAGERYVDLAREHAETSEVLERGSAGTPPGGRRSEE